MVFPARLLVRHCEALAEMRLEYPKVSGELKEFFPKFREELERPLSRGGD